MPEITAAPICLYIHKGTYKEQLTIQVPFLTLIGDSAETTILTFDLYARMPSEDTGKLGTFRSYSCLIDTHDFTARNLTFENSSGQGKSRFKGKAGSETGQALALYVDGDRIMFEGCRFLGNQDTLFTGPLPPEEIEKNGFIGPKQHAARVNGRHCYRNCYIEGNIDFIFGCATAYFENCEFFSKFINREINSYVTAAATPEGQTYGYVMERCHFTGNCPPHSVYMGRPWWDYAKTVLLNCHIGGHICREGWHDWNKPHAHNTVFYAEYGSPGPSGGMNLRPDWILRLTKEQYLNYTITKVLSGSDGWNP